MSQQTSSVLQHTRQTVQRPCGHAHHVGTCAACQRYQLARWSLQLAEAVPAGRSADR